MAPSSMPTSPRADLSTARQARALRKLMTAVRLVYQGFARSDERARYNLLQKLAGIVYPEFILTDFGSAWMRDRELRRWHLRCGNEHLNTVDRKYTLRELLKLAKAVPGDTAECGAYNGSSSYLICSAIAMTTKRHFIFDSFEGLSQPTAVDGTHWAHGDLSSAEAICRANLASFANVEVMKGWIPERFDEVKDRSFAFVHVDVDLYEPTRDSLRFFFERLQPGGLLVCDDYGSFLCPGARRAMDEYFADRPEPIVELPTQQAFVIKR